MFCQMHKQQNVGTLKLGSHSGPFSNQSYILKWLLLFMIMAGSPKHSLPIVRFVALYSF
jgi:hypothetical protein